MIAQTLRGPHNLYRRYQAFVESTITAVGLAAIVMLALSHLPVYPFNWVLVIGTTIAIVGIRWPLLAFVLAVGVMVYPIYAINLYLAVLFLAISALGHRLFVHYMGATVLVLAAPLLAEYHLHWLVPILGGWWWGGPRGAWIGGLAAFWGKMLAGMGGQELDWLVIAGQGFQVQPIFSRFAEANSLNTLLLLVEPFADTSSVILYHLLQIGGWAAAGGIVGSLAGRKWIKYRTPWSILLVTTGGGLVMLVTHLGLPYWLQEAVSGQAILALQDPTELLFSLLIVIIVGTTIHSLRESLDLPALPARAIRPTRQANQRPDARSLFRRAAGRRQPHPQDERTTSHNSDQSRRPVRIPRHDELPEWEPPKDESGLIMLELD